MCVSFVRHVYLYRKGRDDIPKGEERTTGVLERDPIGCKRERESGE